MRQLMYTENSKLFSKNCRADSISLLKVLKLLNDVQVKAILIWKVGYTAIEILQELNVCDEI